MKNKLGYEIEIKNVSKIHSDLIFEAIQNYIKHISYGIITGGEDALFLEKKIIELEKLKEIFKTEN